MEYVYRVPQNVGALARALKAEGIREHSVPFKIHVVEPYDSQLVLTSCRSYKFLFPVAHMMQETAAALSDQERSNQHVAGSLVVRFIAMSCTAMGDLGEQWPLVKVKIHAVVSTNEHTVLNQDVTSDFKAGGIYNNFNLTGYPDKEHAPQQYAIATYRAIIDSLEKVVSVSHERNIE